MAQLVTYTAITIPVFLDISMRSFIKLNRTYLRCWPTTMKMTNFVRMSFKRFLNSFMKCQPNYCTENIYDGIELMFVCFYKFKRLQRYMLIYARYTIVLTNCISVVLCFLLDKFCLHLILQVKSKLVSYHGTYYLDVGLWKSLKQKSKRK